MGSHGLGGEFWHALTDTYRARAINTGTALGVWAYYRWLLIQTNILHKCIGQMWSGSELGVNCDVLLPVAMAFNPLLTTIRHLNSHTLSSTLRSIKRREEVPTCNWNNPKALIGLLLHGSAMASLSCGVLSTMSDLASVFGMALHCLIYGRSTAVVVYSCGMHLNSGFAGYNL